MEVIYGRLLLLSLLLFSNVETSKQASKHQKTLPRTSTSGALAEHCVLGFLFSLVVTYHVGMINVGTRV